MLRAKSNVQTTAEQRLGIEQLIENYSQIDSLDFVVRSLKAK